MPFQSILKLTWLQVPAYQVANSTTSGIQAYNYLLGSMIILNIFPSPSLLELSGGRNAVAMGEPYRHSLKYKWSVQKECNIICMSWYEFDEVVQESSVGPHRRHRRLRVSYATILQSATIYTLDDNMRTSQSHELSIRSKSITSLEPPDALSASTCWTTYPIKFSVVHLYITKTARSRAVLRIFVESIL